MLTRQERKNMIRFIVTLSGMDSLDFIYMTDTDLQGLYDKMYYEIELQRDL